MMNSDSYKSGSQSVQVVHFSSGFYPHQTRREYHWPEQRDFRLIPLRSCPTNGVYLNLQ